MSGTATDRRVRRTRELLRRAVTELIVEKGYDRVTVQDILDRADVGRSTFYAHYRDKDDLLRDGLHDVYEVIEAETAKAADASAELLRPPLVIFQHVERYRHTWGAVSRGRGSAPILGILRDYSERLIRAHLTAQFPRRDHGTRQFEAAVQFITGALIGLVTWWITNDVNYSAEEIHAMFRRLGLPGLAGLIDAAGPSPAAARPAAEDPART